MPPCATLKGVVSPVRLVMSLFAPEPAALKFCLATPADTAPVPPLAMFKVPARVMEPAVPVDGVNPVDPALKEVTETPDSEAKVMLPAPSVFIT